MAFKSLDGVFIKSCSEDHCRWLFYQLQHFKAIYLGHLYIKKDHIGLVLHYCFNTFKAIAAFMYYGNG